MPESLLYEEESFAIIGAALEVHRELGPGFLESVYEAAMAEESNARGIPFVIQAKIPVYYKGKPLSSRFIADYLAYGRIIVEFKALAQLSGQEGAQVLNYLKATGLRLGLLINFGRASLETRRYVN